jgi:CMP-N,N'-diacetyllegionaminic acid synthase
VIYALIPARSGSKQISDKNILSLGGFPLISYSIALAKSCPFIQNTFVSTDSELYQSIAIKFGAKVPFLRPKNISTDNSTDLEFFQHFIDWCDKTKTQIPELIVHLRPTTPLRSLRIVNDAIKYIKSVPEATSLRSCHKINSTPYKLFYKSANYMKPYIKDNKFTESYNQPRQLFPETFIPNGYVDIVKPKVFFNKKVLHGNKMLLWETNTIADIDDKADYEEAKKQLNNPTYNPLLNYLKKI